MTTTDSPKVDREGKILLVGDLLIDKTVMVEARKISPEAPVPVANLLPGGKSRESPGGAGFAAAFAIKDDIPITFLTACPPWRAKWLEEIGIPTTFYRAVDNVTKKRYIDILTGYHLLRVDSDDAIKPPDLSTFSGLTSFQDLFCQTLEKEDFSVVAFLDYRKGLLNNHGLVQFMINHCIIKGVPTYTDSRSRDIRKFAGTTTLKLNSKEFYAACGALNVTSSLGILSGMKADNLLITKGRDGAEYWAQPRDSEEAVSCKFKVDTSTWSGSPDVTGCGDVFDMSFCYHWGIRKEPLDVALKLSVERATRFAYEPIGERIQC